MNLGFSIANCAIVFPRAIVGKDDGAENPGEDRISRVVPKAVNLNECRRHTIMARMRHIVSLAALSVTLTGCVSQ